MYTSNIIYILFACIIIICLSCNTVRNTNDTNVSLYLYIHIFVSNVAKNAVFMWFFTLLNYKFGVVFNKFVHHSKKCMYTTNERRRTEKKP